jgi:hypothetical protein
MSRNPHWLAPVQYGEPGRPGSNGGMHRPPIRLLRIVDIEGIMVDDGNFGRFGSTRCNSQSDTASPSRRGECANFLGRLQTASDLRPSISFCAGSHRTPRSLPSAGSYCMPVFESGGLLRDRGYGVSRGCVSRMEGGWTLGRIEALDFYRPAMRSPDDFAGAFWRDRNYSAASAAPAACTAASCRR